MIEVKIEDKIYPQNLRKIKKAPEKLYMEGNIELLKTPGIAIIGSRECTEYGKNTAIKFSRELSLKGVTIISGMAIGIDSYAHLGTIETGGNTIAVLPSGLNNIYPKENIYLYNRILENDGLIITEYEPKEKGNSRRFLERNRIVSGLAIGTLVIEGGYRSGTSVTARIAKEQGKLVFCIPSSLDNIKGITPNRLIKNGAILTTEVDDIIRKIPRLKALNKQKTNEIKVHKQKKNQEVDKEYEEIYNMIIKEKTIHINEIAKRLKKDIKEINYKLMMLELEEKIEALPGDNYKINDKLY